MPTTTNNKTNNVENTTNNNKNSDKKIAELEATIARLTQMMEEMQGNTKKEEREIGLDKDINPNKKTKITSLTYGYFSLYAPSRGFLKFHNYGDSHTISYAQLVDYVNACRIAAQNGSFYIHNQDMVEDLGLVEAYEHILNDKIIDKVLYSDELSIKEFLVGTTDFQKKNITALVCEKVYNKELTDMGKIDEISKALEVDILKKVNEMKETNAFLSKE